MQALKAEIQALEDENNQLKEQNSHLKLQFARLLHEKTPHPDADAGGLGSPSCELKVVLSEAITMIREYTDHMGALVDVEEADLEEHRSEDLGFDHRGSCGMCPHDTVHHRLIEELACEVAFAQKIKAIVSAKLIAPSTMPASVAVPADVRPPAVVESTETHEQAESRMFTRRAWEKLAKK